MPAHGLFPIPIYIGILYKTLSVFARGKIKSDFMREAI